MKKRTKGSSWLYWKASTITPVEHTRPEQLYAKGQPYDLDQEPPHFGKVLHREDFAKQKALSNTEARRKQKSKKTHKGHQAKSP
ncbi:MAG: hypothetical protein RMJ46_04465 [Bacteroidota bacterium]|nr:hypothetical protein [Bacteroidota bacterium]